MFNFREKNFLLFQYDIERRKNIRSCEFEEVYSEDGQSHFVAASTKRRKRYLGFHKKTGKALKGKDIKRLKNRKKIDCFTFKKVDLPQTDSTNTNTNDVQRCPSPGQGPAEFSYCDRENIQKLFGISSNKRRHGTHHKSHRNG